MGQVYLALLYNVTRRIYERIILCISTGDSGDTCSCIHARNNGVFMVMMNDSLANILGSIGANVKYPHDVQTPTREHCTRERAKQISSMHVQSVQDYKDQYRKMIHDLLKD